MGFVAFTMSARTWYGSPVMMALNTLGPWASQNHSVGRVLPHVRFALSEMSW